VKPRDSNQMVLINDYFTEMKKELLTSKLFIKKRMIDNKSKYNQAINDMYHDINKTIRYFKTNLLCQQFYISLDQATGRYIHIKNHLIEVRKQIGLHREKQKNL